MDESEWEAFLACLQAPLPTTFRLSIDSETRARQRAFLGAQADALVAAGVDAKYVPRPLEWFPDGRLWQIDACRGELKAEHMQELRAMLMRENKSGDITRQEAVSMIPVCYLGVQPGNRVVDMCAAPGSKTSQIVECLGWSSDDAGFVLANDANIHRCQTLTGQLRRLKSDKALVVSHQAQALPRLTGANGELVLFDKVLCDVPCSGDGTLRKAVDVWKDWKPNWGQALHSVQTHIATRGARLLAPGGTLVYSTCSLNPVEDESVVVDLLRKFGGALELVDVSDMLPGLRTSPGLTSWPLVAADGSFVESHADAYDGATALPDPQTEAWIIDQLPRAVRILPHHNNTGGFFVAAFRWRDDRPAASHAGADPDPATVPLTFHDGLEAQSGVAHLDVAAASADAPVIALKPDCELALALSERFGLASDDSNPTRRLVIRVAEQETTTNGQLWSVSPALHNVLSHARNVSNLHVVVAGMPLVSRYRLGASIVEQWKLTQMGARTVGAVATRSVLVTSPAAFLAAMTSHFSRDSNGLITLAAEHAAALNADAMAALSPGPIIIAVDVAATGSSCMGSLTPQHNEPEFVSAYLYDSGTVSIRLSKASLPVVKARLEEWL